MSQITPMEKTITNKIIRTVNKTFPNAQLSKRFSGGMTSNTGEPDITGSICGIRVEIEVKQPGNKPTKLQLSRLKRLKSNNCIAFWTDDAEQAVNQLKRELLAWEPAGLIEWLQSYFEKVA